MKEGTAEAFNTLMQNYSISDMFLGKIGGSLGEVSSCACWWAACSC